MSEPRGNEQMIRDLVRTESTEAVSQSRVTAGGRQRQDRSDLGYEHPI